MSVETERKFLVGGDEWRSDVVRSTRIRQGYVPAEDAYEIRVRIEGDVGVLTIKGQRSGASREHVEAHIPLETAAQMLEQVCRPPLIEKIRHEVESGRMLKWEVDEFLGDNGGLVLAEIELPSPDFEFSRPDWVGHEVTYDDRYYNAQLADRPYSTWSH